MRVYPRHQLRPRYLGESRVYDLLASIDDDDGFAVHSVNLPEHEYKRWGEADFVVVTRNGVTLLEVKGGTVTLAGREWRFKNARGEAIISTEGPARQALSATVALEKLLAAHLDRRVRCRWGVVFPLSPFKKELAELPRSRLADVHTCQAVALFARWLTEIPSDQHPAAEFMLEPSEVTEIREFLVPELSASVSLGLAVRSTEEQAVRLTEQQFTVLESLATNSRLTICGGAGTGKTELAVLCARAEQASGRRPVIVTTENSFAKQLRSRLAAWNIPVVSQALPDGADTLIVDEGQDYAQPDQMKALFVQLPGGRSDGRWRWFMDPNLQFMERAPDSAVLTELRSCSASVSLIRNVRSTREIVGSIRALLDADVGISQIDGFGIKVGFHSAATTEMELKTIKALIVNLVEDGVHPRDICVLGAGEGNGPVCRGILTQMPEILRGARMLHRAESSSHGVACGIKGFRGLESRVVILTDLDLLKTSPTGDAELYIGMSRASAVLHILVSPAFRQYMNDLVNRTSQRVGP